MDSDWHAIEIQLLRETVHFHYRGRTDFFAGGNMFIYFNYEQARNKDFRGPDFFFVWGASPMPLRPYWAVWKEGGKYPNMIIELLSPTTADEDLTVKKDIYEQTFRTPEYYCYDPDTKKLDGWHLDDGVYQSLAPNDKGWLWCEQLKLWLGTWDGVYMNRNTTWLRYFTPDGALVPTLEEDATANRRRAEAAEAELIRLKQQIDQKKS
jgi:Uma2 family endonuclease